MTRNRDAFDAQMTKCRVVSVENCSPPAEDEAALTRAHLALKRMPARTLRIFVASRVDGLRYAEIARRERMTCRQVRRHMRRAIKIIAKHMP